MIRNPMRPVMSQTSPKPAIPGSGQRDAQATRSRTTDEASSPRRLLPLFAPILALIVVTTVLALGAWFFEGPRTGLLVAVGGSGAIAVGLASLLLYRQTRRGEAVHGELQQARARISAIVEAAMDAMITVDGRQRMMLVNAAAEQMFRWPRAAMIGQKLDMLLPERFRGIHASHIERFGATGVTSRRMGAQSVLTALRADGEEFPIEASISQITEGGGKFFTVILRDVTERMRAEQALRRSKEELQLLASAAHQTREHEQSRIARELHDELGQSLTALKMLAVSLRETAQAGEIAAAEKLDRMEAVLDRTVAATRRIAADLRPLMLDDLGLVPAIEWLAEEFSQRQGVPCVLTVNEPELELTGPQATAAFRIVQEALTNIARHAQARSVDIDITRDDASIRIRVRDDGCGFVAESPSRKPDSRGLLGMRERAYLLGGNIAIESAPGRGTTIEARLPLQAPPEAA
jgi:PAS domain S-box-containing protein